MAMAIYDLDAALYTGQKRLPNFFECRGIVKVS
jgi:hypothetical protein